MGIRKSLWLHQNLLTRYFTRLFVPYFISGLVIFTLVQLVQYIPEIIQWLVTYRAPFTQGLKLLMYLVPFSMTFTFSMSTLLAVLMVLDRIRSFNEIIALQVIGIPLRILFIPFSYIVFFIMLIHTSFLEWVLPYGNTKFLEEKMKLSYSNPSALLSSNKTFQTPEYEISIQETDGEIFQHIEIIHFDKSKIYLAKRGKLLVDKKTGLLSFWLSDVMSFPFLESNFRNNAEIQRYKQLVFHIDTDIASTSHLQGAHLESLSQLNRALNRRKMSLIRNEILSYHRWIRNTYVPYLEKSLKKKPEDSDSSTEANTSAASKPVEEVAWTSVPSSPPSFTQTPHLRNLSESSQPLLGEKALLSRDSDSPVPTLQFIDEEKQSLKSKLVEKEESNSLENVEETLPVYTPQEIDYISYGDRERIYVYHRHWSLILSSFLMLLAAMPLGLLRKKSSREGALFISALIIFIYNGILILGNLMWQAYILPPALSAWLANIALAIFDFALIWRTRKML